MNLVINAAESIPARSAGTVKVPLPGAACSRTTITPPSSPSRTTAQGIRRVQPSPITAAEWMCPRRRASSILSSPQNSMAADSVSRRFWASSKATTEPSRYVGARAREAPSRCCCRHQAAAARCARGPSGLRRLAGTGTILLVDDEPAVRNSRSELLEAQRISRAASGGRATGAIDMVSQHPEISAVVLDLAMPVMGGETAAPILRARRPDLPLILSSGYSERDAMERVGSGVVAAFLEKPYQPGVLAAKVEEVLRIRPGSVAMKTV